MSDRPAGTRKQEHEIVIDASIESVWKAITDAEELTRWFVDAAKVEPGVGGKMRVSWDGSQAGEKRIEAWEPNRRLRVELMPFEMGKAKYDGQQPIVDEYTIERRDGKTVLRLVSSGIPDTPEWDGFYNGINTGWPSFFRTMRHYLEHHGGKPRTSIKVIGKVPGSLEEAWARLVGPAGFSVEPIAGRTFATRAASDDPIHGEVVFAKAPQQLELRIRDMDDAFFAHSMACSGGNQYVYSVLSLYGKSDAEVDAVRAKWQTWLMSVLQMETVAAGAAGTLG